MVPVPNDCCSHILFPIIPFGALLHDSHFQAVDNQEQPRGCSSSRTTVPRGPLGHQGLSGLQSRQSEKMTLARQVAHDAIPFITLDDATTLMAASADVIGFVRDFDRMVIAVHALKPGRAADLPIRFCRLVAAGIGMGRIPPISTGSASLSSSRRGNPAAAGLDPPRTRRRLPRADTGSVVRVQQSCLCVPCRPGCQLARPLTVVRLPAA